MAAGPVGSPASQWRASDPRAACVAGMGDMQPADSYGKKMPLSSRPKAFRQRTVFGREGAHNDTHS
jgi:hypothetical protein